jgi:O-antigen/teichoic acid export membrane protein
MSLRRNTIWNLAGMGLPLLLGLVAIPYLYSHLGAEKIGILTLVWALIGYFSLFDFGLGRALTQQVSASRAAGHEAEVPTLVKSGLLFTALTGLAGGLLLAVLAYPLGFGWLNTSKGLQESVALSLLVAALGIPMTTITTGLRGVLEAYEDFPKVNILRMLLGASNFGLPMLSVMWLGPSLVWVIGSLVVARLGVLLAHLTLVERRLPKQWHKTPFSKAKLQKLFSFGAWMTVSNIVGPLMVTADRFIISAVLGASVVAFYTVPAEMLLRILIVPAALTSALFPRLSIVMTANLAEAGRIYRKCLTLVSSVLFAVCVPIAIGSRWGMTLWLGQDFADQSWIVVSVMALGLLFNGIAHVPFSVIQAAGDARTTAYIHLLELLLYIPLLFVSMQIFGLVGAAVAWTIRVGFDLGILLIYANKVLLENDSVSLSRG